MNILITRPSPYGDQLVKKLNNFGKTALHLPLITFTKGKHLSLLNEQLNSLSNADFLFIMSQTAIKYANSWLLKLNISWPKNIYYYAIGHKTAYLTYKYTGIPVIHPTIEENSEALLKLPGLNKKNIKGKNALILSGNKGRKILQETLKQRGVQVKICETYHKIPITYNGNQKTRYMLKIGIDTLVITSKDILYKLYTLIPYYYRNNWLLKCTILVTSKRIATTANQLGWKKIIITTTANNHNLINILLSI